MRLFAMMLTLLRFAVPSRRVARYPHASPAQLQSAHALTRRNYTPDIRSAYLPLLWFLLHANSGIWGKVLNPLRK
jgi:hypothetical protein